MLRYPFSKKRTQKDQANSVQESPYLEQLAQTLQPLLQDQIGALQLQVRCAIRQGTLFVLIEHLLHVEPDSQQAFADFEAIVRKTVSEQIQNSPAASQTSSPQNSRLPVKLFLRIAGHQQPYQFHTFSVSLVSTVEAKPSQQTDRSTDQREDLDIAPAAEHLLIEAEPTVETEIAPAADREDNLAVAEPVSEYQADRLTEVEVTEVEATIVPAENVWVNLPKEAEAEPEAKPVKAIAQPAIEAENPAEAEQKFEVDDARFVEPIAPELPEELIPIESAAVEAATELTGREAIDLIPIASTSEMLTPIEAPEISVDTNLAAIEAEKIDAETGVATNQGLEIVDSELLDQKIQLDSYRASETGDRIDAADFDDSDRIDAADLDIQQVHIESEKIRESERVSEHLSGRTETQSHTVDEADCEFVNDEFEDNKTLTPVEFLLNSDLEQESDRSALAQINSLLDLEPVSQTIEAEPEAMPEALIEAPIIEAMLDTITAPPVEPAAVQLVEPAVDEMTDSELQTLEATLVLPDDRISDRFAAELTTDVPDVETAAAPEAQEPQEAQEIEPSIAFAAKLLETAPAEPIAPEPDTAEITDALGFENLAPDAETLFLEPELPEFLLEADFLQLQNESQHQEDTSQDAIIDSFQVSSEESIEEQTKEPIEESTEKSTESLIDRSLDISEPSSESSFCETTEPDWEECDRPAVLPAKFEEIPLDAVAAMPAVAPAVNCQEAVTMQPAIEPESAQLELETKAADSFEEAIDNTKYDAIVTVSAEANEHQEENLIAHTAIQKLVVQASVVQASEQHSLAVAEPSAANADAIEQPAETLIQSKTHHFAATHAAVNPAATNPVVNRAIDPSAKSISFSEVLELEAWSNRQSLLKRLSLSAWIFAGSVGVFGLVAGTYALTRPCVIGSCPQIAQAHQMSDRALNTIQTTESALAIVGAYSELREVNGLLSPIPLWSPHYQEAQALMTISDVSANRIGQIVNALEKANEAAQKSQNPPHPLPRWREIQWLWRDAIAALRQVPRDSPVFDLAQRRLLEYQASLADINRRVGIEQAAHDRVNAAKRTAQIAEAKAGIAKTTQDWQQSAAGWQTAIQALDQIPQGTMAHQEAEQLIALYQPRLQEANQRRGQEAIAETGLRQANQLAEEARSLEQQNQWSEAKASWQQAVASLQRIPQSAGAYQQAQATIQTYRAAIAQAEKNAVRFDAMRAAQPSLDRVCGGLTPICTYFFAPEAIRVQITRSYDQATERIMTAQGNQTAQVAVTNQVSNLLRSLAEISDRAQVPIELYNANGSRFGVYSPQARGFVAQ